MSRLLLNKENRKLLFDLLKEHYQVSTTRQLGVKLRVSEPTLKTWRIGKFLTPSDCIPSHILNLIKIDEVKDDDWGKQKIVEMARSDPLLLRRTKLRKKTIETNALNHHLFTNQNIKLDISGIRFSRYDLARGIKIPDTVTPELAEEVGIHIGDGTLPVNGYNYSSRGDIVEKYYYIDYVRPLYTKLFGIIPPVLERPPISGIEFDSKAIYDFKSKVLGLTVGEKKGKIRVPQSIMKSDNKAIFQALLRGVTDTDGCYYMPSTKRYPRITINILSRPLIQDLDFILRRLGFIPSTSLHSCTINVYGPVQLHKWLTEIWSKNPKHLKRIHRVKSLIPWSEIVKTIDSASVV